VIIARAACEVAVDGERVVAGGGARVIDYERVAAQAADAVGNREGIVTAARAGNYEGIVADAARDAVDGERVVAGS